MQTVILVWAILATAAFCALAVWLFFRDQGSFIFPCASLGVRNDVIMMLEGYCGVVPKMRHDTTFAQRAFMSNGAIINYSNPDIRIQGAIGTPSAGMAVVAQDPAETARKCAWFLTRNGYEAEVTQDPDPDIPKGSMVFVTSNAFNDRKWVLVIRRHFTRMGPKPAAWNSRKAN